MTAQLVLVADGAYPHDPYSILPPDCHIWAGYVGGHTPHIWTSAEVDRAESDGLEWLGIWTGPDLRAITMADAQADAAGCIAAYRALGYGFDRPALYDVEAAAYFANPLMTAAAAERWCALMRAAGWVKATWYGPCASSAGWRACWDAPRPVSLSPGVFGVQFAHGLAGDAFDLSVFDANWIGAKVSATGPENWDAADLAVLRHELSYVINAIADGSNSVYSNDTPVKELETEISHLPIGTGTAVSYTGTVELHPGT